MNHKASAFDTMRNTFLAGVSPQEPDKSLWTPLHFPGRPQPEGLGPVSNHNAFSTILLALAGHNSPYWGPRRHLENHLGLEINPGALPTYILYWTHERGAFTFCTYPLYNLDQTSGDRSRIIRLRQQPQEPHRTAEASQVVHHLLNARGHGPTIQVDGKFPSPTYDIHTDTVHLKRRHLEKPAPNTDYQILKALVASTAKTTSRRLFPPARELFVNGLATASIAYDCGFRDFPEPQPGEHTLIRDWVRTAYEDFFHAIVDAQQADEAARGWAGRTETMDADYRAEHELSS